MGADREREDTAIHGLTERLTVEVDEMTLTDLPMSEVYGGPSRIRRSSNLAAMLCSFCRAAVKGRV